MKDHSRHVLRSIEHPQFLKKRVGELSIGQVAILFKQWVPVIRSRWSEASPLQRKDCLELESAFKRRLGAPWEQG